uniref:Uncharacterized protein n=1 Tax=Caenorhabditis japonica TaxID=281687 RepID=A0A8R1E1Y5_CAEJA
MDEPKICCIPARPLIFVLAIIGVGFDICAILSSKIGLFQLVFVVIDALLLYGVIRMDEPSLNVARVAVSINIFFAALQALIFPVLLSSLAASGTLDRTTLRFKQLFVSEFNEGSHFWSGLLVGYLLEIIFAIFIGIQVLKFVAVHRLWEYAKTIHVAGQIRVIV